VSIRWCGAWLAALLLSGCQTVGPVGGVVLEPTGPHGPNDIVVAHAGVLECNAFRLLVGKSYCRSVEPPAPPPYCTRSLGTVDCWAKPNPYGYYQRGVADGPFGLTAEQEWDRTGRLPLYSAPDPVPVK
jgi:hypothetical protein